MFSHALLGHRRPGAGAVCSPFCCTILYVCLPSRLSLSLCVWSCRVLGAGKTEGSMDAANMLKPMLARGQLRCIGATTLNEYKKHVEKDPAFERRFQQVLVPEPSVVDTVSILRGIKGRYEEHHGVRITDSALVLAAKLSARYITQRFLPDKAIDVSWHSTTPCPCRACAVVVPRLSCVRVAPCLASCVQCVVLCVACRRGWMWILRACVCLYLRCVRVLLLPPYATVGLCPHRCMFVPRLC